MKKIMVTMASLLCAVAVNAKTLVAYYSYTNNVERIVNALSSQIACDVIEIEPAEKGQDYAADNYALGTQLLNAIRSNPDAASSYPAIDPVNVDVSEYDTVILACPLWWSQMAAPFQTFLFQYGRQMAGKNIGLIVSSYSSGISGVVADAKRLIPAGNFIEPNLWIRSSQTSNAASLVATWLGDIDYDRLSAAIGTIESDSHPKIIVDNGLLRVDGDFDMISLYNLSGDTVIKTTGDQIDVSFLIPGVYISRLSVGNRSVCQKILLH